MIVSFLGDTLTTMGENLDIFYHLTRDSINTSIIRASSPARYLPLELVANVTQSFDVPMFNSIVQIPDVHSPERKGQVQ